jgi:hypothetical protein
MWLLHEDDEKPTPDDLYFDDNRWLPSRKDGSTAQTSGYNLFSFFFPRRSASSNEQKGEYKTKPGEKRYKINEYYGSKIAMYFGWCTFYANWLLFPSAIGIHYFFEKYFTGKVSHTGTFFAVLLSIWSTCFIEFWKRRSSELTLDWGVYGYDERSMKRTVAKSLGERGHNKLLRYAITIPMVCLILFFMCYVMVYFIYLQDNADSIYGSYNPMRYYPMIVYSLFPTVFSSVFGFVVDKLTEFEEHKNDVDVENHKIYKHFALQFVNSYCMLFYVAFWLKDMKRLEKTLFSLLFVSQISGNLIELLPVLRVYIELGK